MAEAKNSFIKSKMNKDLDARLLPSGEYRNAINAQVSKSEGSDVGTLQNILGNTKIVDFAELTGVSGLKTIGHFVNDFNSTVYLFLTDTTPDVTDPVFKYYPNANNFIVSYDTLRKVSSILVSGAFLNFSTDSPIYGVNILENLLFWTDNRNQPRKINVNTASGNSSYYSNEDQISVAKYNPFQAMELWRQRSDIETAPGEYETTMYDVVSKFYPNGGTALVDGAVNNLTVFPIDTIVNDVLIGSVVTGEVVVTGTTVVDYDGTNIELSVAQTLDNDTELIFNANPYYEADFNGDSDYLKDKFVRFAYRFKFDDGEYSIFSPFTQPAFIPKQDGYFMYNQKTTPPLDIQDENDAFRSTVVQFMENKVNKVLLNIPLPFTKASINVSPGNPLRVTGIDVLYKESDGLSVKVLDSIDISTVGLNTDGGDDNNYVYNYQSKKPYKTLPEKELIRVYDKTPVRALGQEIISNRVVYSNYQDKHTPPSTIDYNVLVSPKDEFSLNINTAEVNGDVTNSNEFEVDNINTSIVVGFKVTGTGVSENTFVVSIDNTTLVVSENQTLTNDTVLTFTPVGSDINTTSSIEYPNHSLKENRNYQIGVILSDRYGRQSTVILSSTLSSIARGDLKFVGSTIYSPYRSENDEDSSSWLGDSLKVLFNSVIGPSAANYNTLEPGIYNGDSTDPNYNPLGWYSYKIVVKQTEQDYYNVYLPGVMAAYPNNTTLELGKTSFSVLINDNINKVPRDLTEVGPQQKQFRSSVKLFGRVENTLSGGDALRNTQYFPGRTSSVVSTIADNEDLFNGDNNENYVPSPEFYQIESDPLISKISTNKQFGVVAQIRQGSVDGTTSDSTSVDVDNLLGTPIAGDLITGYGVTPGTSVVSFVDPLLTMSSNQTLLDNTVLTFTPQFGSDSVQHLAVFETEPVESLLDIFWETSTSGIVSNLNSFILNEGGGSDAFANWNTDDFCENDDIGTSITNTPFYPVDNFGQQVPLANIDSLIITQILDNQNPPVNVYLQPDPAFNLVDNGDGTYEVTTNQVFVRGSNAAQNRFFTFYFELTTNDGSGSQTISNFTETASVCNQDPLFGGSTSGSFNGLGSCPTAALQTSAQVDTAVYTFYGRNGSVDNATQASNGGVYEDVTFELISVFDSGGQEISNAFELGEVIAFNPTTLEPTKVDLFRSSEFTTPGNYVLVVRVIDGDGAFDDCVFGVDVANPGCKCTQFIAGNGTFQTYTKCNGETGSVTFSPTDLPGFKKFRCARSETPGESCDTTVEGCEL